MVFTIRSVVLLALLLLLAGVAAAQERFANGKLVRDNAGNVFYSTGEYARMSSGQCQYRNAGYGGAAYRDGMAFYPSGQPLRSGNGTLFYQNGQVARQNGGVLFHQNGSIASNGGGARYDNGAPAGGSLTLREPFNGGSLVVSSRRGVAVGYLLLPLGDEWSLIVNLDTGEWEVSL